MLTPHASSVGVSCSPSSSVVTGGASRPQLRGAGPSSRATTGPVNTSARGVLAGAVEQCRKPSRAGADVVVHEHDQLARGVLDAAVARRVQPQRAGVGLIARAGALGHGADVGRFAGVVHDDHLGAAFAGLGHDRVERHLEVGGPSARGYHDRGRCHGLHAVMGPGKSRFASPGHPTVRCWQSMVLFLHNRYRTTGGEERVVEDLLWLVRERLGEDAELLARESAAIPRGRAALGLLRGGLSPREVAAPSAAGAPGSSTPTTCSRASAGARWRRRGGRERRSCCTCISTGSCARSGCASPTATSAPAVTGATPSPGSPSTAAAACPSPPPTRRAGRLAAAHDLARRRDPRPQPLLARAARRARCAVASGARARAGAAAADPAAAGGPARQDDEPPRSAASSRGRTGCPSATRSWSRVWPRRRGSTSRSGPAAARGWRS